MGRGIESTAATVAAAAAAAADVCRSTIERHLLSSATDPFSRASLALEQLQPATDVMTRMQQWMKQHRDAASAQQQQQQQQQQQEEELQQQQTEHSKAVES
jgi:hypothetical protein